MSVWIFGIVERESNRVSLYPVDKRDECTLVSLIKTHLEPGSTIYCDGWLGYHNLNQMGYEHFTVLHKHTFSQEYRNVQSNEILKVNINRIEGAWKHAKNYFRKIPIQIAPT